MAFLLLYLSLTVFLGKEIEMVMDWLTAAGLVSALVATIGWYYCQVWESKQAAAQNRLPPRFRALNDPESPFKIT